MFAHRKVTLMALGFAAVAAVTVINAVPASAAVPSSPTAIPFAYTAVTTVNGVVTSVERQVVATPDGPGPQGTTIYCDHVATYSDPDGSFTLQHQCGGSTAPWGYKLSTAVCAGATTNVHEAGMMWALSGKTQGTQAYHIEPCDYHFHGSFNPARDNSHIAYSDVMTWNKGNAHYQVQIYGSFILSSNGGGICGGSTAAASALVQPDC